MDCEKSDVSGCPMEPLPAEFPIPAPNSVDDAASAARSEVASAQEESSAWRDELSARLNRYRARRKAPPPRYPSLKLPFGPLESSARTTAPEAPVFESVANHALALDEVHPAAQIQETAPNSFVETELPVRQEIPHVGAKIIEFPRFAWGPPPPPPDQLAEPVMDRPRILEVPEVAPPPPALGGILIEPAQIQELEKRPGIDIPLQSAPLRLRLLASLFDGMIVAVASALFGYIFWKITSIRPPRLQIIALAAGTACILWAAYQYLLIVYSGATPGLRAARLELTRFDGGPTRRSVRRWRVLASYLSFASLGMGYAWLFLDEDALCWHDRITHTYLAPRKTRSK
jgi:uncharacterized RDD family membrane protein YckC